LFPSRSRPPSWGLQLHRHTSSAAEGNTPARSFSTPFHLGIMLSAAKHLYARLGADGRILQAVLAARGSLCSASQSWQRGRVAWPNRERCLCISVRCEACPLLRERALLGPLGRTPWTKWRFRNLARGSAQSSGLVWPHALGPSPPPSGPPSVTGPEFAPSRHSADLSH